MARRLRDTRDAVSPLYRVLILAVASAIAIGAYLQFFVARPPTVGRPFGAEVGDIVEVAYIGTFADTGRVFDTSYRRVAEDNVTFPKAASFEWRGAWSNFSFTVGSPTGAVPGFDEGVRGMVAGETRRIVAPPEKAYGRLDTSKVFERPLLQEVPAREVMNTSAFNVRFRTPAQNDQVVTDPFWKWNVTVKVTNNIVTITHSPSIGERLRPYGAWDVVVESIDDSARGGMGIIYVRHLLRPDDAGNVLGREEFGTFTVLSVDLERGIYIANYNREVVGRTLVFDVALSGFVRR